MVDHEVQADFGRKGGWIKGKALRNGVGIKERYGGNKAGGRLVVTIREGDLGFRVEKTAGDQGAEHWCVAQRLCKAWKLGDSVPHSGHSIFEEVEISYTMAGVGVKRRAVGQGHNAHKGSSQMVILKFPQT